jgi:hypothetical protein
MEIYIMAYQRENTIGHQLRDNKDLNMEDDNRGLD